MSRVVDVSKPEDLSEADALYAFDRGMLTDEQMEELGYDPRRSVLTDPHPSLTPNFGDANTTGKTQRDVDKAELSEEDLEPLEANLTEPQLQGVELPQPVTRDEDEDVIVDPDDSYDNWKAPRLREECAVRGLSTSGNKPDLVDRLERNDRGEDDAVEEV
jgi:SAP domain